MLKAWSDSLVELDRFAALLKEGHHAIILQRIDAALAWRTHIGQAHRLAGISELTRQLSP